MQSTILISSVLALASLTTALPSLAPRDKTNPQNPVVYLEVFTSTSYEFNQTFFPLAVQKLNTTACQTEYGKPCYASQVRISPDQYKLNPMNITCQISTSRNMTEKPNGKIFNFTSPATNLDKEIALTTSVDGDDRLVTIPYLGGVYCW